METVSSWRATYVPGRWLVLAGPTSLVVMQPAPPHMSGLVSDLWQDVVSAADVSDLAQRFSAFRLDLMPHFAAFFWAEDGMHSLVRGAVRAVDPDTGEVVAQGEGFRTWNEVGLQSLTRVRVDMDDTGDEPLLALPLAVGVVLASSVTIDSTQKVSLVLPGAPVGDVWTPTPAPSPVLPARAPDPSFVQTPAEAGPDETWGVRDAGALTPVELLLDENGDGIPDARPLGFSAAPQSAGLGQPADLDLAPRQNVGLTPQPNLDLVPPQNLDLTPRQNLDLSRGQTLDLDHQQADAITERVEDDPADPFSASWSPSAFSRPPQVASPVPPPAGTRNLVAGAPFVPGVLAPELRPAPEMRPQAEMGPAADLRAGSDSISFPAVAPATAKQPGSDTIVLAALCAFGHPNRPGSSRCRVCGQHVDNASPRLVQRPVLAQLVTATGARAEVNGTVLIGRAPSPRPGDGDAALLSVSSPNSDISRTHVKVSVHDWDIVATDLNSTNGTTLVRPGQPPVRMMPGTPVTVEPGTVLDLGDGGLVTVVLPG
jgi:hypothetical protein